MKKLLYLCLFPFLGISCMEDLGTYDYNPLHEITIDTLKNRTIEIYHQLEVEAKISFSGKETPLEYCWYRYTNNDLEVDTLSLEKKLVYNVNLSVGNYTIYLKVTDKETGLSSKSNFTLSVTGKFDKGLMVLGEVDGTPNLVFLNTAGNLVEVYGADNGHELGTHPVIVADASTTQIIKLKDMFILNGTSGGVTLNNADLTVSSTFEDLFYIAPQVINPQAYYKGVYPAGYGTMADFIINNGKLHGRLLGAADMLGYGLQFNPAVPGDYELSPYAVVNGRNYLFYDNQKGRFLNIKGDMMSLDNTFSSIESDSENFDPSNLGLQLVYMAEAAPTGNNTKRGCGIFKNTNGQLEKLEFTLSNFNDFYSNSPMRLLSRVNLTPEAEGIEQSAGYAMSVARPFLYFTKGSQIYQYDLNSNRCFPIYDTDTVKINGNTVQTTIERIYMEYVPHYDGYASYFPNEDYNNTLYVVSSENGATGKKGSIHILKLADNGTVEERTTLYENVCGNCVSMCYKR